MERSNGFGTYKSVEYGIAGTPGLVEIGDVHGNVGISLVIYTGLVLRIDSHSAVPSVVKAPSMSVALFCCVMVVVVLSCWLIRMVTVACTIVVTETGGQLPTTCQPMSLLLTWAQQGTTTYLNTVGQNGFA